MTFEEMRYETEILYESINSNPSPGFDDTEWAVILTASQRRVVRKILRDGINSNSTNRVALTSLIKVNSYASFSDSEYYLNLDGTPARELDSVVIGDINFDNTIFWILDEYVTTEDLSRVPLVPITFEEYQSNFNNPFKKPIANNVEGFWVLNKLSNATGEESPTIITDGTVLTGYKIIGVVHPDNFPIASGSDCVLNEWVHADIVMDAVKLAHMSVLDANGFQLAIAGDALPINN